MTAVAQQKRLLEWPPPSTDTVFVNNQVSYRTEAGQRVLSVHGIAFAHYDTADHIAEAYAMVQLFESGYANQNDIASAFGCSSRSLRRYQARLYSGGIKALADHRGRRSEANPRELSRQDQTILRLKSDGLSNRSIGGRLGLDEKIIRKRLRHFGWVPESEPELPFPGKACPPAACHGSATDSSTDSSVHPPPSSWDSDARNRTIDRLLAAMGLIEDAVPLFAPCPSLPRAGVLVAVPSLVASGLLAVAQKIYGSIGPAFYGLRTTLVAYVLLALLRIPRPEKLKEYAPDALGRIVGLDRILEVKTLRRKLARLAALKGSRQLGREMAERRIAERGQLMGFLYVDGHVRAYHGQHPIPKAYLARTRLAVPATTDYWVNDPRGDPLFVVTAEANQAMTKMLVPILDEIRSLVGPDRQVTIVFDRGGWSPKLFVGIISLGFDLLTYRKGRVRRIAEQRFTLRKATFRGRTVEYRLHEQAARFLRGKLRLRQITRLSPNGHQTPVLTSRWDLCDIEVAYRMFERWRQENFFKYMRQEYQIDALTDYEVEPDDPNRSVPNPARKVLDSKIRKERQRLMTLRQSYGENAVDYIEGRRGTLQEVRADEGKVRREIRDLEQRIAELSTHRSSLPARVAVSETQSEVIRLATERKHLANVLKMVAYQIESDLVEMLRPHYARIDHEGRTLVQTLLQSTASIEPTDTELRIQLQPLSSHHRSTAVATLCEKLNQTYTCFPGTQLRMRFAIAEAHS